MSIRDWTRNNPAIVTGATVVALLLAGVMIYIQLFGGGGPPPPGPVYFYDLQAGQVFTAGVRNAPPIVPPGGSAPSGMRAHLYACGDCPPASEIVGASAAELEAMGVTLAYLERYTDAMHPYMTGEKEFTDAVREQLGDPSRDGLLVRRVSDTHWTVRDDPEGEQIAEYAIGDLCGGTVSATRCLPDR